ncbi:MAG: hypothetical protein K6A90_03910 [Lachnospiraceae bacterium]|nr:hypothetical protein [Lachnospiraceae bacterium]
MSDLEKMSNDELERKEAKEILKELLEFEKREARYQKITSILIFCLVLIMGIVSFMIVPVAVQTLTTANATIVQAQEALTKITDEMESINGMVSSITETSNSVNKMVNDNAADLTTSVQNLNSIDFEGLNKAIRDLQDAVAPMAKVGRIFGG